MIPQPPSEVSGAVENFRAALTAFPPSSYRIARDWAPTWAEDEYDYFVEWEIRVEPVNEAACPFDVWFSEDHGSIYHAFGFDSVAGLAQRLQLEAPRSKADILYIFGFEPISLRDEHVHAIVRAVFEGQLEARYWTAFGVLLSTSGGLLVDVGVPHVRRRRFGKPYRYAAYAGAP